MAIPQTMQAAFIRRTGGVEAIEIGELPVPRPGPTDVLLRMQASEVNFVDLFVRSGAYATPLPLPFVIGRDVVGSVAAVGAGVTAFEPGDRAWCNSLGHHGRQGSFAEYSVVAADRLYPLPAGVAATDAAAVLHTAGTAWLGLLRSARLQPGETVFVEGAAGGVGSALVQIAAAAGARVIATAAAADQAWVEELGAAYVIDFHQPDAYQRVAMAAPGGVDVWWDTSGHNHLAQCLPLLRVGGRAIVMSGLQGGSPEFPVGALYTRDISLLGFAISNASVDDLARAARGINALLAEGKLRARIGATFRLADAARAHAALAARSVRGRIVIVP